MNNSSNTPTAKSNQVENIVIVFLDSLILFLSLSGNSLVIYTVRRERKLQTTCNYLLLNLAFCDIMVVSLGTSVDIMLRFTGFKWILGSVLCRIINPALTMFYISGSFILVVISIDRYKLFVHPLKARYGRKHVKYAILVVHSISLCCVLPFAVFLRITDGQCHDVWPEIWYRKAYTVFLFLVQYALPLTIMGFAYTAVAISLLRSKSSFKQQFESERESSPMKLLPGVHSCYPQLHSGYSVREYSETAVAYELQNHEKEKHYLSAAPPAILEKNSPDRREILSINDINISNSTEKTCQQKKNAQIQDKESHSNCFSLCHRGKVSNAKQVLKISESEAKIDQGQKDAKNSPDGPEQSSPALRRQTAYHHIDRRNAIRGRSRSSTLRSSGTPSRQSQRNNRALKMILLVVVVFAVFMLPLQVISLLLDFGGKPTTERYRISAWFVVCSYFGSCTLNPFIYGLVDRTFRAAFKKFAKKVATMLKC